MVPRAVRAACLLLLATGAFGCAGDDGAAGPAGLTPRPRPVPTPIPTDLRRDQDLPGLKVEILRTAGGTGPGGNVLPGDVLSVTFRMALGDGRPVAIEQVDLAGILVSGPTGHYQPVLGYRQDVRSRAVANGDGSYGYTFPEPVPATYLPPLNDSPALGAADGEWAGQPLRDGTYTVGLEVVRTYLVDGQPVRDAGNDTWDFLVGGATRMEPRDVVTTANCNRCHTGLRAHGAIRRDVGLCLLCHTAGAEDGNDPAVAGGTPGETIDFRVMIHKLHSGAHLPSVLGVGTALDGSRSYTAPPRPYRLAGSDAAVHDYSHVSFPVWPNRSDPLPRDVGYASLSAREKRLDDAVRSGAAACATCHGDPDGDGPLPAPAQGGLAYSEPSRAACGSCHDDVHWDRSYVANRLLMPPQRDDAQCAQCHPARSGLLAVEDAHAHPLLDATRDPGLVLELQAVVESGAHNGNGRLDPGETPRVRLVARDGQGRPVDLRRLTRMEVVVTGPVGNPNILLEERVPVAALSGASLDAPLPQRRFLELLGVAGRGGGTFSTAGPHWDVAGAPTTVWVRRDPEHAAASALVAAVAPHQNFCDVESALPFARGTHVVVDDGLPGEEYLRVQWVEGNRLWFSSTHDSYDQPGMRRGHLAGAVVRPVGLERKEPGVDYALDARAGRIRELRPFGEGRAVLASYTTDFVIPATYPTSLNDSPDLGASSGEWTGLPLLDGTYTVTMWGGYDLVVGVGGEETTYRATSRAAAGAFLVGAATTITRADRIATESSCLSCHDDLRYHGGRRRGYAACISCHGTAGAEDRPRYVAPGAPATVATSIGFRRMLHGIHAGRALADARGFRIVGFGTGYPDNYTTHTYETVGFPSTAGGTADCVACHGAGNAAWRLPAPRDHPEQAAPTLVWSIACGSCHDSPATAAHIAQQTAPGGVESCAICHGPGRGQDVTTMHRFR